MQVDLKRVGLIAELTAIGSPEEIADLVRLTGAFGMEWRSNAGNGTLVAFGIADEDLSEQNDCRHVPCN